MPKWNITTEWRKLNIGALNMANWNTECGKQNTKHQTWQIEHLNTECGKLNIKTLTNWNSECGKQTIRTLNVAKTEPLNVTNWTLEHWMWQTEHQNMECCKLNIRTLTVANWTSKHWMWQTDHWNTDYGKAKHNTECDKQCKIVYVP